MQSIIEEQEATNEELKSANEEIQSSNEELQSTNEELETAKEELQSTNEELTTLNEELQTRNTELTQVNNDLTNLLSSVNVAILMLGTDLTIRRFTPLAERIFNLIPSDVGRRLSDLSRTILMPDLESTVRGGIDNLTTVEREVQEHDGRWYSLRIRPYRTHEHKIEGAVLVLVDIDQLRRALETVLETVRRPLVMLGPDLKVLHANEAFRAGFGLAVAEVRDKFIYEVGDGHFKVPEFRRLLEEVLPQNKQVDNYEVEATLPNGESRKMLLSARRFYEDGRGMQMLLLAFEEAVKER